VRRWFAIAKATALEIISEPLSFLLMLSALAVAVLAPALHYHQFGEPTRMARDAGLSAFFTFGTLFAVIGLFRSFRRELDSGTAQMAISHSVSRAVFLVAKFSGAMAAYALFALILSSVSIAMVYGAAVGGAIARQSGDVSRLWGPALTAGAGTIVLPPMIAAALNRFWRFRFVPTAFFFALLASVATAACFFDFRMAMKLAPAWVALAFPVVAYAAVVAAAVVGMKPNYAVAALVALAALSVPAVGNYYLADTFSRGGVVEWGYVALAGLFALPAAGAFLVLGVHFFERRDIA
jgi:ABC-type transport system involved in multi-copper enzyme maturation permease subunit